MELPFPFAGPMPPWRSLFAWFGLVPLLWALLSPRFSNSLCAPSSRLFSGARAGDHPLRRGFLLGYLAGLLWFMGNCYWVRDTMMRYGDMPPMAPTLLLIGFSAVLGLYWGLFGLGLAWVRRATGSMRLALVFAPFLWTALELAAAHITSVPWDQLGYSQVDNALVTQLAPSTGVYGISFLVVAANALLIWRRLVPIEPVIPRTPRWRLRALFGEEIWIVSAVGLMILLIYGGFSWKPPEAPAAATAVLIQPDLDVANDNTWGAVGWDRHIAEFAQQAAHLCGSFIAGIPQTGATAGETPCTPSPAPEALAVWPESPAPFIESDARFKQAMAEVASSAQAPLIIGGIGDEVGESGHDWRYYNSAIVFGSSGKEIGRYDKIHLVPFGEYIPFQSLLTFAHKLTGRVSSFSRGSDRKVFFLNGPDGEVHRYGVFICYEAVFGDEVRHFAKNGAQVLVNLSDDGWYGDTSAPWQHLNMARMRAIENRRWILRDTNNGVTAAIDPYGTVRQSIPRHQAGALAAQFGFRDDMTFYSAHGDVFAWACAILSLGVLGWCLQSVSKGRET